MIISVASGKGGTGKTIFSTSLALLLEDFSFIDCDVEAPNAHFFLNPDFTQTIEIEQFTPDIIEDLCTKCGLCVKNCEHNALGKFGDKIVFFPELCHGCPTCKLICPENAIEDNSKVIGLIKKGNCNQNPFATGTLNIGEIQSATLISKLRSVAEKRPYTIIDCPPCTGHPLIRAIRGSDYAILVTEPTPFGLHDLKQALELLETMDIPSGVVINRDGIGNTDVEEYCNNAGKEILMKIPYSKKIAEGYSEGIALVEILPELKPEFMNMIEVINSQLKEVV
jgi:MinD superfamily P-loop ATPase